LGHGGGGFPTIDNPFAPNSLESISSAMRAGADGVELDIQMTKDSVLVLYHDDRLESSTNGQGFVSDWDFADLSDVCFRSVSSALGQSQKIVSLHEALLFVKNWPGQTHVSLNIHPQKEIQDAIYDRILTQRIYEMIKAGSELEIFVESPQDQHIMLLRTLLPKQKLFLVEQYGPDILSRLSRIGADGLVANIHRMSPEESLEIEKAGLLLMLYGVKIRADIVKSLDYHALAIQTDNIPLSLAFYP
jgi:glycerophosphoryl diester phosphodiesterase